MDFKNVIIAMHVYRFLMQFAHLKHIDTDQLIHHCQWIIVGLAVVQGLYLPVGT